MSSTDNRFKDALEALNSCFSSLEVAFGGTRPADLSNDELNTAIILATTCRRFDHVHGDRLYAELRKRNKSTLT